MFARKFLQKASAGGQKPAPAPPPPRGCLITEDLDPHVVSHYGIPSTASLLAFDPIQCLLAVGTLDGRIKVIGGDNIEAILSSPKQLPFKNLEFIENQGFLVSISNDNEIEVWDLDLRKTASSLLWESNITAFSILHGTGYMYVGDEYGMVSVVKYNLDEGKLVQLPYYVPTDALAEAAGLSSPIDFPVVGLLSQPSSRGTRLLIAFSNGLLFLWDASEDRVVLVRGNKDLPIEGKTVNDSQEASHNELSDLELDGKEISSLCWASADGSVLAVGYVDGDILFWDFSEGQKGKASNYAVKLQLSSAEKRLPVIVMHWCLDVSRKNCGGKLFIYGGDIIGSDEVLTMLALDWSSGMGGLKCVGRADLTLSGSFADMVLSPIASSRKSGEFLFLLTNPGQLQAYDDTSLASLMSQKENNSSASPLPYPMVVPTMDPRITVAVFAALNVNDKLSLALSEIVVAAKSRTPRTPSGESAQWPLTGGVPSHLDDYKLERLYIAGYQDGSVRIWDATYPCLSLIYDLKPMANGIDTTGVDSSVTAISFCSKTSYLAVGNESGMVRLFKLIGQKSGGNLEVVTNTDKKAYPLHQEDGPQWLAAYSFLSSPVCTLGFVHSTRRLAVGFKCGRVAMLDIGTPSVLFVTNSLSDAGPPIESLCLKSSSAPTDQSSLNSEALDDLILCAMTKDGQTILFDGNSGKMLPPCLKPLKNSAAICMHIIENCYENSELPGENHEKKSHMINASESHSPDGEQNPVTETKFADHIFENSLFLMCSEYALRLYSLKSLSQGSLESTLEVSLPRPCCWMGTLKKDGRECAVLLLYKTGHIEIRSFPNLEVVGESSLLSLLSWNFKPNMEKTVCSDDFGHVFLVNGCEVAILSFMSHANGFRLPESLPMLHDKVLAAAADATFSHFPVHKKNHDGTPKFLSGIIKGFRSSNEQKVEQVQDFSHLGNIFSSPPYLKPSVIGGDDENIIELNIDDIEIDEPINILPEKDKKEKKDKRTDKERLFEGASSDAQPKTRTVDEIKAKYRKAGETSAIASQAKDKLLERGEKLERISQRTAELQDGAENFASMAHELAKQMEKRKWWNI
ncbi:V-SNARE coiled-coil y domain-containing protein [Hirschfeldia incana]|nr:V-SNARE coiled-coil y domain-containing protein [Hirschfeldia incana]